MSGGHYDYKYFRINELSDEIEKDFLKDGKYKTEDWSADYIYGRRPMIEADYFHGATPEQREYLLKEIKSLIKDLHICADRAKELEWFMSGDTGIESYIQRLKEIYKK